MTANSTTMMAQRYRVAGRVQGVFYRASTRQQAQQLGLVGYARNLPDGCVEVLAIGTPEALEALRQWLWRGPPAASVTDVQSTDVELNADTRQYSDFATL